MFSFFNKKEKLEEVNKQEAVSNVDSGEPGTQEECDTAWEKLNALRETIYTQKNLPLEERDSTKAEIKKLENRLDQLEAQGFVKKSGNISYERVARPSTPIFAETIPAAEVEDVEYKDLGLSLEELNTRRDDLEKKINEINQKLTGMREKNVIQADEFRNLNNEKSVLDKELQNVLSNILLSGKEGEKKSA